MTDAPTYYNYAVNPHEYTGSGVADANPEEPGNWLFPARTTQVAPMAAENGKVRIFDESTQTWSNVEDHRGQKWWVGGELTLITEVGPVENGTQTPPPIPGPNRTVIWENGEWVIKWDFRGQYWWADSETWHLIDDYGDPRDDGLTPFRPNPPITTPIPSIPEDALSKRQIVRAMIIGAGIEDPDSVMLAAMEAIVDPTERALAREDWKYAPYYLRTHELFSNELLLAAVNMTPEIIDSLWTLGLEQPR